MKPYYDQDGIRIYHGDCREVLPKLEPVDLVLTDIPYGEVNRESGGLRSLDKGGADDVTFSLSDAVTFSSMLASSAYLWCGTEQASYLRAGFAFAGMSTRLCVWEKTNPSPMNGEYLWLSALEVCIFARKPKAYFSEHCCSPVWRGATEGNDFHPTQKPEWLFRKLVKASCPEGGTVLDFCMGSGTTLRAAKDLGRKAIGIEIEDRYCEIAARRLDQGVFAFSE